MDSLHRPIADRLHTKAARGLACSLSVAALLAACAGEDNDDPRLDRVEFSAPTVITQARVLATNADSPRCADSSTDPCFAQNKDILAARRTLAPVHDLQVVFQSRVPGQDPLDGSLGIVNDIVVSTLLMSDSRTGPIGISQRADSLPLKSVVNMKALGARVFPGAQTLVRVQMYEESAGTFGLAIASEDHATGNVFVRRGTTAFNRTPNAPVSNQLIAAAADFDDDGRDSVVFVSEYRLGIATPVVTDGKLSSFPIQQTLPIGRATSMVVANFFGTGPVVAITVPTPGAPGLQLEFYAVDPKTSVISKLADKTLPLSLKADHQVNVETARLVAGNFNDVAHQQLVVVFDEAQISTSGNTPGVGLIAIARGFDAQKNPVAKEVFAAPLFIKDRSAVLRVDKGRFLADDPFEGLVLLQDFGVAGENRIKVNLVGFGPDLKPTIKATTPDGPKLCIYGMAVGNFDRRTTDDQNRQAANRNMQLALAMGLDCSNGISGNFAAAVWQVSPTPGSQDGSDLVLRGGGPDTDFVRIPRSQGSVLISDPVFHIELAVLDLQDRSLLLGAPSVVNIERRSQPSVVIAAPPMHVDFIDGELTNFSAAPSGFFARYKFGSDADAKATTRSKTSWTFGAEESLSTKVSYGSCEEGDCAGISERLSAKQDLDGQMSSMRSSFSSQSSEISQATGFSDVVWYTDSSMSIYIYPVLNRRTCPGSGVVSCDPSKRAGLSLIVAGPDTVHRGAVDGSQLAWYQPPWMEGHALSYPGSLGQLKKAVQIADGQFNVLSKAMRWTTGTSDDESITSWRQGSVAGSSTDLNQNYSFSNELSTFGSGGVQLIRGEFEVKLSVSGSFGFQNLSDSETSLSKSTGVGFTKQAAFAPLATYGYGVTPYIFAQQTPVSADSVQPSAADMLAFGVLQTGFVVDLDTGGTIWRDKYASAPDLALLHPQRMQVDAPPPGSPLNSKACLNGRRVDCAETAEKVPERLGSNVYHRMRGLFITSDEFPGQGPQLSSADAGDVLRLEARVHNLSLKAMPDGAKVMVRFYGMVWDSATNAPAGPSFHIGTVTTDPVPPFQSGGDTTNWTLVPQSFDTTRYAGKDLKFWVVTWIEDGQRQLVGELADKGLTSIPSELAQFEEVAALEQRFGNNLGFYDQPFHVIAPRPVAAAAATPRVGTRPSVAITEVGSESRRLGIGGTTMVAARVRAGEHDLRAGLTVAFYDGDPGAGGRQIGVRWQPFLKADTVYDFRVPFRAGGCGRHTVYVVTGPGTRFEHSAHLPPIEVTC